MWSYSRPPRQELESKCLLSKFALDFISSFQMHVERAWKYWLDASVGRRVSRSVCYCWGESGGLAALRASQLPVGFEILLSTKQTETLEGQNKYHSVFNPLPSLSAKQKNWPGNMMSVFVQCPAFSPLPLPDFQLWDERRDNFFPFDRVPGQDNALDRVGFPRAKSEGLQLKGERKKKKGKLNHFLAWFIHLSDPSLFFS